MDAEQRIKQLEQRIAVLEEQVQAQPTIEEITKVISEKLKSNFPL
jgi:uncharacterized coiled-coil protein SlyX